LVALLRPGSIGGWLELAGALLCGLVAGLLTAALAAARHGRRVTGG
jgi:hypothetical protein